MADPISTVWIAVKSAWDITIGVIAIASSAVMWAFNASYRIRDAHKQIHELREDVGNRTLKRDKQRAEDLLNHRREMDDHMALLTEIRLDIKRLLGERK